MTGLRGEPGIHNHRPRVMDSGLATFGGARNDQAAHLIGFMESLY